MLGLGIDAGYKAWKLYRSGRQFVRQNRRHFDEPPKKVLWKVQGPGSAFLKEPAEKRQKTATGLRGYQETSSTMAQTMTKRKWEDAASYIQYEEKKDKNGKYVLRRTRRNYLLDSLTQRVRYRFGRVQDVDRPYGSFWLSNQPLDATWRRLPAYIVPLFAINQGGGADNTVNAHYGMYELMITIATGQFQWRRVPGIDPTITAVTNAYSPKAVMPSDVTNPTLGRKAMIDWSRIKLCMWGKQQNPTKIRVQLVRFVKRNYTVEDALDKTAGTSNCDEDGNALWAQRMKFLLNGHSSGYGRNNDSRVMKVLKRYDIDFNPIDAGAETATSDPRPHMKHLDLFNRWNRVLDFTVPTTGTRPDYTQIVAENRVPPVDPAYTAYLNEPEDMVYLLIESVQPRADGTATATDPRGAPGDAGYTNASVTASFDLSIETSWSHIQRVQ